MVRIHGACLATVISSLVRIFVIHVIRNPDLRKNKRMIAHVVEAFLPEVLQLIAQAIPDRGLSNLDCKGRRKILATENTDYIDVIDPVPAAVSTSISEWAVCHRPMLRKERQPVIKVHCMNHVRVIVFRPFHVGGYFHDRRLTE